MLLDRSKFFIFLVLIVFFSSGCTGKSKNFPGTEPYPEIRKTKLKEKMSLKSRKSRESINLQDGIKQVIGNHDSARMLEHNLREIKKTPKNLKALIIVGKILSRTNKNEEVIEIFNRAMKLNPEGEDLRITLICRGRAYANLKKFDLALKDLNRATGVPGDKKLAYLNLAAVNNEMDRYIEAVNILKTHISHLEKS